MKVYVLFHADLEDDRDVRAVYATRELAEAALSLPDVTIVEHNANCRECTGRHVYWRRHSDACCSVDEWEVADNLPTEAEPETPQLPRADFGLLVPESFFNEMWARHLR